MDIFLIENDTFMTEGGVKLLNRIHLGPHTLNSLLWFPEPFRFRKDTVFDYKVRKSRARSSLVSHTSRVHEMYRIQPLSKYMVVASL